MSKLRSISTGGLLLAMLVVNCKRPYSGPSTQKTSTKKSSADEAKKVPQKLEEQKQVEPKENPAGNRKEHVESATSSQEVPRNSTKTSADEAKKVPQKLEEQKQVELKEELAATTKKHEAKPENPSEPKVESATSSQKVPEIAQSSADTDDCKTPRSCTLQQDPIEPNTPDRSGEASPTRALSSSDEKVEGLREGLSTPILNSGQNEAKPVNLLLRSLEQAKKGKLRKWISEWWSRRKERREKKQGRDTLRPTSSAPATVSQRGA